MMKKPLRASSTWFYVKWLIRILLLIAVLVGLYSYAMFQGGFVSWFLFYSVTTLIILMILYAAVPLGTLEVERDTGGDAFPAGTDVRITVTVRRKIPFPFLYLAVEDGMEHRLQKQTPPNSTRMIFYPGFKRTLTYTYEIPAVKRGEYQFLGTRLSTSDFFGLFKKRRFISQPSIMLVFPKYYEMNDWSVFEKHDEETRRSKQEFIEDRTSIAGARDYVPGDKLTSIDWKVTARSGKLMTKEFEEFTGQQFMIVLNNRLAEQSFAAEDAYERGIELAASIVMYCYKKQLKVGLSVFGKRSEYFQLGTGEDQQRKLIRNLAQIEPEDESDAVPFISEDWRSSDSGQTILFISTAVTEEVLVQVRQLHARRHPLYFFLMETEKELNDKDNAGIRELRQLGTEVFRLAEDAPAFERNRNQKGGA